MTDYLILIAGLALVLIGANALTDGAAGLARRLRIPPLVIGLTIVTFGSSAPELAFGIASSIEGTAGLAVGNVVGSNLFNILMTVGVTAMIVPITVTRGTLSREMPVTILSSFILLVCANDVLLGTAETNTISRTEGVLLLCFFLVFMSYAISMARREPAPEEDVAYAMPLWSSLLRIVIGTAALAWGGKLFVDAAGDIAAMLGVSSSFIGLTLAALGSSMPELATSIVSVLKRDSEIAIGNVIGSCLFNVFLVLGVSATISPLQLGALTNTDFIALLAASVLLLIVGKYYKESVITRTEGTIMMACYAFYMGVVIALA